uniref:Ovule protein n=1 Tax=Steinernema glaseri TaxID=37863 RepID=A0A1I7ZJD8_9BILA
MNRIEGLIWSMCQNDSTSKADNGLDMKHVGSVPHSQPSNLTNSSLAQPFILSEYVAFSRQTYRILSINR